MGHKPHTSINAGREPLRALRVALSILAAVGLTAVLSPAAAEAAASKTYSYSFGSTAEGWSADFADYSPQTADMQLEAGIAPLPPGTAGGNGFFIQGNNHSDDLYMFLKRRLGPSDGIIAGQRYSVRTSVTFWTDSSADCIGAGGSPGGSVYLKAGASTGEPLVYLDSADDHYRVTLDKGSQGTGGTEATVLGNIDNGLPCQSGSWVKVTRTSSTALTVQADASGYLWLNAGTDSGYEGLTQLYYSGISTTLTTL